MATCKQPVRRSLGRNGPQIPRLGLGLMGASSHYCVPGSDAERLAFLDEAYKRGETFWDSAQIYGDSEELLGKWFAANPEKRKDIFLATKFGVKITGTGFTVDTTSENCRASIEQSLKRLGLEYVDIYYPHRLDKVTPIEKTVEAMVELKKAGKVKYLGLCECSAESLRRAHTVHPISCVQIEYNPFCLQIESPETRLLETARELGVAIVSYSPLGHGLLAGTVRDRGDFIRPGDMRVKLPLFSEENLQKNLTIVDRIAAIARAKSLTPAQLTLAWILAQGDDIFAIPGTTKIHRLEENLESLSVFLSEEEERAIRELGQGMLGTQFQAATGYSFADTPTL
ncbi:hypothetical protein ASPZODRAFT_153788 [Penicilliopsis zonata CBS 506.65]|uniref:NADP-dependent oxidoreductase domain-containing protein n=1 Tax=Penicilliopsis zonata CBS 506.65 TaxID=1073090 RepID=A0A1L9SAZ7_9EURO|nr:hypothetical protein ASPZODRAFT_153788 [Penicilliopsis zonata CBS 506.65]OJJ44328.1 hypothetical protein ASPZODRAFT_153788 [Penicilliopsis zonata CBS 506.65]